MNDTSSRNPLRRPLVAGAAGLAALFVGAIPLPAAGAAEPREALALAATLHPVAGGEVQAMVHVHVGRRHDRRPTLRAILTGADPYAILRILASRRPCRALRRDPSLGRAIWSGKADAVGTAVVWTPRVGANEVRVASRARTFAVATAGASKMAIEACAPVGQLGAVRASSRPTDVLTALAGRTADGTRVFGMAQMNMKANGLASVTSLLTGVGAGSYRLSIGACSSFGPLGFNIDVDTNEGVVTLIDRTRIRLDRRTARAIARKHTDFSLSRADAAPSDHLACSGNVKFGKVLGVNYLLTGSVDE